MRLKRVLISPELIASVLTLGSVFDGLTVTDGLPDGSQLISVGWDARSAQWAFDFTHHSFDLIEDGGIIPHLDVCISRALCATD